MFYPVDVVYDEDRFGGSIQMFIRNLWYVAAWSHDLDNEPLGCVITGMPVVLYRRTDGTATALEDRCPRRFAPLSAGRVEGDDLRCMYHGPRSGAITFIQRFGSALNLNVHLHMLIPDGIYTFKHSKPHFQAIAAPSPSELTSLLNRIIRRITRQLVACAIRINQQV